MNHWEILRTDYVNLLGQEIKKNVGSNATASYLLCYA